MKIRPTGHKNSTEQIIYTSRPLVEIPKKNAFQNIRKSHKYIYIYTYVNGKYHVFPGVTATPSPQGDRSYLANNKLTVPIWTRFRFYGGQCLFGKMSVWEL